MDSVGAKLSAHVEDGYDGQPALCRPGLKVEGFHINNLLKRKFMCRIFKSDATDSRPTPLSKVEHFNIDNPSKES